MRRDEDMQDGGMQHAAARIGLAVALGAALVSCGTGEAEASGFARRAPPEAEPAVEPAVETAEPDVAVDRPVLRAPAEAASESRADDELEVPAGDGVGELTRETPPEAKAPAAEPLQVESGPPAPDREALALRYIEQGSPALAARVLSDLIHAGLVAGGGGEDREAIARRVELLDRAQAAHRWSPRGTWDAVETTVQPGEGLIVLRKRLLAEYPGLLTCTGLIARANELQNPNALVPGEPLRIPREHPNVLVDLSARWVFYRFGDEIAAAWPAGVGKPGQETPTGRFTVGLKQERPAWHPRGKAMVPYGDPENPLGSHWLAWRDVNGRLVDVGFHGTTGQDGVGDAVSMGCVRLSNEDVQVLHDTLPLDAEVTVQP
jgi:hypothetical protein